jgi:exosortase/archaeosortase family protein
MTIDHTMGARPVRNTRSNPWRAALGLLAIALAVFLIVEQTSFRAVEATLTADVVQLVTSGHAHGAGSIVYFGLGTSHVEGIVITTLCSTVVLVTPLLALAGILLLMPSLRLTRVLLGLATALALAVACNLARYAAASYALQHWGRSGFDLVHEYLGSLLVIFGFALAFILLLRIATRRPRASARHTA